jgi:hypothetical protein
VEAVEDGTRDRELEDAVAEELEPLVRRRPLVRPRRVREDLLQPLPREGVDQPRQLVRVLDGVGVSRGAR